MEESGTCSRGSEVLPRCCSPISRQNGVIVVGIGRPIDPGIITRYVEVGNAANTALHIIRGGRAHCTIAQFGDPQPPEEQHGGSTSRRGSSWACGLGLTKLSSARRPASSMPGQSAGGQGERWDMALGRAIQGTPRAPVPGICGDRVLTTIALAAGASEDQERPYPLVAEGPQGERDIPDPPVDRYFNPPRQL